MNRNRRRDRDYRPVFVPILIAFFFLLSACGGSGSNGGDSSDDSDADADSIASDIEIDVEEGEGEISLQWEEVSDVTYDVLLSTDEGCDFTNHETCEGSESYAQVDSGFTVEDLEGGETVHVAVRVRDEEGDSAVSEVVPATPTAEEPEQVSKALNDTGIDWCTDGDETELDCPVDDYPGQDGEHGRDAEAREGTLDKEGAGVAGFDYTKLDAAGDDLEGSDSEWSCVRDNHTGLVWEVKTESEGLHYADNTYTWYQPDGPNHDEPGVEDIPFDASDDDEAQGGDCTDSLCDTHHYVEMVNDEGLCGASDWRLPTVDELNSLVHRGGTTEPTIDDEYFPQTAVARYWTASPLASPFPDSPNADFAWFVTFGAGLVETADKSFDLRVRLVRGGE